MLGSVMFALAAAAATSASAQPRPNEAILDAARRVALGYARNLPNFLCTEEVRRFGDWYGQGAWVPLDTIRLNVAYHDRKEAYQIVSRNNRPTKQKLDSLSGAFTQGEFGSTLRLIFEPESKTEFTWREWDLKSVHPLAVFDYRVPLATSKYVLRALTQEIVVGFRGEVAIDAETGRTMRWTVDAEIPSHFPIAESFTRLEYGVQQIAGEEYVLPVHAEVLAAERMPGVAPRRDDNGAVLPPMRYRNLIEFRDYCKFSADTRITF